ncbi:metallophosphoesterase family protein [Exilibacterium tricleocarpae]|uniref:Metallophosphoesterase family protein n=2 Tax=Exilibacterium tricleocarpae TaxID=2591008 RepID=A0A545SNI6_9GAMM|nr:metallophosphoesterase family protein [Exilibacterium tricleocarpae]
MKELKPGVKSICLLLLLGCATTVFSATKYHRLTWDGNASSEAVVGFSPSGDSRSPYVTYGTSTDESQWAQVYADVQRTFSSSLSSYFVRLENLPSNSSIYYRVCDQDGCGQRFWFRTAPADNSPYTVIAGGDTRSGWTTRRKGNQLVAKIRPLFIMHGGDFTNANSAYEMGEFLKDWQLTFSSDQIDGKSYKRIYPIVPTHGNHEDGNFSTLCQVFGVDYYRDGNCNARDTVGAVQISPLLRVYTLNSQFRRSGWSSYANWMNNWLDDDLRTAGTSVNWRFAQYHKPMFPHYSGKSEAEILHSWWGDMFYDRSVNLVIESDTHINKITKIVRPTSSSFATASAGTVYAGEGSWGAPARSANDPKSWTQDLASIQQFKVLQVKTDKLQLRTAQFNSSAQALSRAERTNDPLALPNGVDWWSANGVGEVMQLGLDSSARTIAYGDGGGGGGPDGGSGTTVKLNANEDTFVAQSRPSSNYNGSSEGLLADGSDSTYGSLMSLLKFDVSSLPECSEVTAATLRLRVTNRSQGNYLVHNSTINWSADSATWTAVSGADVKGEIAAEFLPSSTGYRNIPLNQTGVAATNHWLEGSNNGFVIASGGTGDGLDFYSSEQGYGPELQLVYKQRSNCNGNPDDNTSTTVYQGSLENSSASDVQPGGQWFEFAGGKLQAKLSGPIDSDFDLYFYRWNGSAWIMVAKSESSNANEAINQTVEPGYYYFRVYSYSGSGDYHFSLTR